MSNNETLAGRRARLSPQQQALLESRLRNSTARAAAEPAIRRGDFDTAPLTLAQQSQWLQWQLDPDSTAYHVGGGLALIGDLDIGALRDALAELIARHDMLRAVFPPGRDGQPEQIITAVHSELAIIDLSTLDATARAARYRSETQRVCTGAFDIEQQPPLRIELLKLKPREHHLLVMMHHIIADAWSVDILLTELAQFYAAALVGRVVRLPAPEIRYLDFAAWQRAWLQSGDSETQLRYWREQLGDRHPVLELPFDHSRGSDARRDAARHTLVLPAVLVNALKENMRTQGATLFMALLTGLHALLFRYTGAAEIRTGVPLANRSRPETAGVIGCFINTVVLKTSVDARLRFADLLQQVRVHTMAAQGAQEIPLEKLVEVLRPATEAQTGANPQLFQVLFNHLQRNDDALARWPDLDVRAIDFGARAAPFELTVETTEFADGAVQASFRYAADRFEAATIVQMAAHYRTLLEALLENPQAAIGAIPMLDSAAQRQLRVWGTPVAQPVAATTLHALFEGRVRTQPDAIAASCDDETLSYAALNARANRLAHHLIDLGVVPETRVGIAMARSLDMLVGLLAILKAGGAYVPLDPEYPEQRLRYLVADSGVALLLTHNAVAARLPDLATTTLMVDVLDIDDYADSDPQIGVHSENLAYVIYTSGSTGRPKGVQITHRNVSRLLRATDHWFGFSSDDVWTLFHSYAFDFSVWEIFGALCSGGRLVVVPYWISRSPTDFLQLLRDQRVTVLNQTPSAFGQLMHAVLAEPDENLALRTVIFGGEALEPERLRPWITHFGDQAPQLINMYGITETTVHVTWRPITALDLGEQRSPVGVAIPDLGLQVLDSQLQPVPVGVAGELYVAGAGLARGYLQRAALSAERFIADPLDANGGRLYRTGDRVRWNRDGELDYLGRIDKQVKIRGFRIELGEIETRLLVQPGVRDAVVTAREGGNGPLLVAYVVSAVGSVLDGAMLRRQLGDVLPDYMVPAAIIVLPQLPLTTNGKVDLRALPAPEISAQRDYQPPQGGIETALAQIWADVLGIERVGRSDNFFALGGHSLLCMQLASRIKMQLQAEVNIRDIFQHPRLDDMAASIMAVKKPIVGNGAPPPIATGRQSRIVPRESSLQRCCPASSAQQRQWFLWQLDPGSTAYHIAGALLLRGALNVEALRNSFTLIAERHEALRTVYAQTEPGQVAQVIGAATDLPFTLVETAVPFGAEAEQAAAVQAEVQRLYATPFDLRSGPLWRVGLIRFGGARHVLVVVMHHSISDAWSLKLIVNEFVTLYRASLSGQSAPLSLLPALPIQYADYAVWQQRWLEAGERERQLAYWRQQLGGEQPVLHLPTDRPRRADGRYRAARLQTSLPATLVDDLRVRAGQRGATLFMALLAAFQCLLYRYTGQHDIRVGVPMANRQRMETEGVVGLFVNTQVLRNSLHGGQSLHDILAATRAAALAAQDYQDLPFEQLVEALQPERSLNTNPLFQVLYNHQHDNYQSLQQLPGLTLSDYPLGESAAQFELVLDTRENDRGDISVTFTYASELFDAATIERMAGHYQRILQALAEQPQQKLSGIGLLSHAEQQHLRHWSETPACVHDVEPVHRLFEQQANRQPNAIALIFNDDTLSYAVLNQRANQLAHYLVGQGVGPDVMVGIAVERSFEMVIGVLAILKAGGAYVPLDPEYPQDRLRYIIADSDIRLVLTTAAVQAHLPVTAALTILRIDALDLRDGLASNPDVPVHPDNLAYVIYTSGSTGRPKGAANRHASLSSCMAWMQSTYQLTAADAVLHKAPFGFDVSVWEVLWPLTAGIRLVIANPGDQRDPARIIQLIHHHRITTLNFVPAMLQAFLADPEVEARTRLKYVMCGGETVPASTQREALQRLRGINLQNLYGPTETAIHVTHWTCKGDARNQLPIGRPIAGTQAHVLDADMNPVPQGVAGELYLGGISLGRGYLNRAGLTADRFVADPFAEGARLYRTGDAVRWNGDGELDYLGRIDQQVKIRGFRIEPGEIEAQLLTYPAVREAAVTTRESASGTQLVAYVALHAGVELTPANLRHKLAHALPDYMVPAAIVLMPRLPLNANGKVDRKILPEPEFYREQVYEPPQGELETALAKIWGEVLGIDNIGRNDSFFELGGHSLLAIQLLERIRRSGMSADIRSLFRHPRLAAFAAATAQLQDSPDGAVRDGAVRSIVTVPPNRIPADCSAIQRDMLTLITLTAEDVQRIEATIAGGAANIQDIYPLAPLQEGILFHHLLQRSGDAYVTPCLLRFDSCERLQRFVDSLNQVIARHDILRTAVLWEGLSKPVQVVQRKAHVELTWQDIGSDADGVAQLNQLVHHSRFRIDVRRAPMIAAIAAFETRTQRWLLQLPSHHLVLDHTSLDLLVQEIALIQQDRIAELPVPVPFRNFVAQASLGVTEAEHEEFFTRMLGDVDEPTAPFGLLDIQGEGIDVSDFLLPLDRALSLRIRQQARRHDVSAAALFHLAWALVLGKISGRDDVVFGSVLFGRMQGGEGGERAFGLFINTLPVRIRLGGTLLQCLDQTHRLLTDLLHHEHASLTLAQRCSALPGGTPLFSSLFNYRYVSAPDEHGELWQGTEILGGQERTNYPLDMSVNDAGEDFTLVLQADQRVDGELVCRYLRHALQAITAALDSSSMVHIREVDILSAGDIVRLRQWGENPARYSDTEPVHRLFEQQAAARPDAIALIFGEQTLSYAELNRRVNQLAHYLIGQGVGPDVKVGIAVERSPAMVVGLLAILKAGGAYVPLDPEYPQDRLRYIIDDSDIRMLLTQRSVLADLPVASVPTTLLIDTLDLGNTADTNPLDSNSRVPLHRDNLAYVIYTSGSTGQPKGVGVPHHALVEHALIAVDFFALTAADRVLQFSTFNFDGFIEQLFPPLLVGAGVVLRGNALWDSATFHRELLQHRITVADLTTAYWQVLVNDFAEQGLRDYGVLRQVHAGGEALPPETLKTWRAAGLAHVTLLNTYGPTEATVTATTVDCGPYVRDEMDLPGAMPIGVPLAGRNLYVLDADGKPVPQGVAGELYIGGDLLARGYLNRPGLTAQRFVADPFAQEGGRLYRTGDLVRWNVDGQLDYLGRIDQQLKIRGFRVEPGEIETQLLMQPAIREAIVIARDSAIGKQLVAYVAADAATALDPGLVRQRLGAVLPHHMVPGAVVVLPRLPLNPNGKVDRQALPEPEFIHRRTDDPPQGVVEIALASIWAAVLNVAEVGRHDNFFELGGHSLLAIQVNGLLIQRHACEVPIRIFFDAPTVARMAAHLPAAHFHTDGNDPIQAKNARLADIDRLLKEFEV